MGSEGPAFHKERRPDLTGPLLLPHAFETVSQLVRRVTTDPVQMHQKASRDPALGTLRVDAGSKANVVQHGREYRVLLRVRDILKHSYLPHQPMVALTRRILARDSSPKLGCILDAAHAA